MKEEEERKRFEDVKLLAISQQMKVASQRLEQKGEWNLLWGLWKECSPTNPLWTSGQTREQGSLLKLQALELLSTSLDTLIISSSDTLLILCLQSRIQEFYRGTHTISIPVLFYRGSYGLFSSFNGLFFLPLPTFGDEVYKCLEDRLTFPLPYLYILKRRKCDINQPRKDSILSDF